MAWRAGATRWSFASCHFNENFCCVALSGLATCNGLWHLQRATATATRRQQGWQWRWRWQLESGNQPCYGSLAVPHPAPSVHLSLSLTRPQSVVALCSGYGYGYGKWLQLRGLRPCDALEIVVAAPVVAAAVIFLCCCFRCLTATG